MEQRLVAFSFSLFFLSHRLNLLLEQLITIQPRQFIKINLFKRFIIRQDNICGLQTLQTNQMGKHVVWRQQVSMTRKHPFDTVNIRLFWEQTAAMLSQIPLPFISKGPYPRLPRKSSSNACIPPRPRSFQSQRDVRERTSASPLNPIRLCFIWTLTNEQWVS